MNKDCADVESEEDLQYSDDHRDNEHDSNAGLTLAVLFFGLNSVKDEQEYRQCNEQFHEFHNDSEESLPAVVIT